MAGKAKARYVAFALYELFLTCFMAINTIFLLLTPYCRTIIVRLISTAQTGFFYTTQRLRQGPKLAAVKYDPKGRCWCPDGGAKTELVHFS
jgi:ribosomal protein L33